MSPKMDTLQCENPFSSSISLEYSNDYFLHQTLLPELGFRDDDQYFLSGTPSPTEKPSASTSSCKKLNHNAYERDRRKKLNDLYSSLCMLLPEADRSKKMSIPMTVSRVIKYIPDLQKQVTKLAKRKERLLLNGSNRQEGILKYQFADSPVISASCLANKEIMVNICVLNKKSNHVPLSKYLKVLEGEGLKLINASTSHSYADQRTFYNLHFEVVQGRGMEGKLFCDHIITTVTEKTK